MAKGRGKAAPGEPMPISLGVRSAPGRAGPDSAARLINCYAEKMGDEGVIPYPLYPIDGLQVFASPAATGGVRALVELEESNTLLAVVGSSLYQRSGVGGALTETIVGSIDGAGFVTTARNRNVLPMVSIVAERTVYIWQNGAVSLLNDPDLPAPNSVSFVDGYFVYAIDDGRWFISAIDDSTVSPLDFASAEANPDGLIRVTVVNRDLLLMGPKTIEAWRNVGTSPFPFQRVTVIQRGLLSAPSVANFEESLVFVASDGTVRRLDGYATTRISDHAIERAIADEPDKASISGEAWQKDGHSFYACSGTNFTWVFDGTTGLWHERRSYGDTRWRCSQYVKFNDQHLFGDFTQPKIYIADRSYNDEAGSPLVMTVQPPAVNAYPHPIKINRVYVRMVAGEGLNSTDDAVADPQVMLEVSGDGGVTFGGMRSGSTGRMGERLARVTFNRLGYFNEGGAVLRFTSSAAVKRAFIGLAINLEKLNA